MAREEVHAMHLRHVHADERLHEAQAVADLVDHCLVVLRKRRVLHEVQVPVLRVVQVGEAAVDERADEVERERRAFVAAHQAARIGRARCGVEGRAVHEIAAVGRKREAVARLRVARAGLRVLAGEAADAGHAALAALHQHQAHLQQDLEARGDRARLAAVERLRAVAALEDEALPGRGLGKLRAERVDLEAGDERRQLRELGARGGQLRAVRPLGLLERGARAPRRGGPAVDGEGSAGSGGAHGGEVNGTQAFETAGDRT